MYNPNIREITLEAHHFGAEQRTLKIHCNGITRHDAKYKDDRAADGAIMRSTVAYPSIVAKCLDTKELEALQWTPTDISYLDENGDHQEFRMRAMNVFPKEKVEFLLQEN